MDFGKVLKGTAKAPLKVAEGVLRSLSPDGGKSDDAAAKAEVLRMIAEQGSGGKKMGPAVKPFSLPELDDSLSEIGEKRRAEAEAAGEPFIPGEDDYADAGPYGFMHKKTIHDALQAYADEILQNSEQIDYDGILKQRLADLEAAPEPHRTNPLYLFAMGMGNPEHAREMVQEYNANETAANEAQNTRWRELLDMKQQALEGTVKQALAEGEHKKVISGKWLEALAGIEQDKAKLAAEMGKLKEKNTAAERRAQLRGQWALEAVKARAAVMLQAKGLEQSSVTYRNIMDNSRAMTNALIRKGVEPEEAYDQVQEWMQDQLDGLQPVQAPSPAATSTTTSGGAAGIAPQGSSNPLEAQINKNRKQ